VFDILFFVVAVAAIAIVAAEFRSHVLEGSDDHQRAV